MKKILCFLILGLWSFLGMAQNMTNERARELFGYRFIWPSEAGYSDNLTIPFSEDSIKYDFVSWLVPLDVGGIIKYRLIQAIYSENHYEKSDTLSLIDTQKAICLLARIRPSFPNETGTNKPFRYFFRVKDKMPSKAGMEFRKTISQNDSLTIVVDLPSLARAGILEPYYISYLIDNKADQRVLGFEVLPRGAPQIKEQMISILTLICLNP